MSVTFKCKQTGNTVTFRDSVDIDSMRKHPEYEELLAASKEEVFPQAEQVLSEPTQEQPAERNILEQSSAVKRGRPSKKD